jgi:predicted dehydrogenase
MQMSGQRITRRKFVGGAAVAALGAPLIVPASALGLEDKKPASERLTLGFIGMGTMNRGHLNHFLGQKDVQVLAVCDVDTTRREHAKKTVEDRYGKDKKDGKYKGCDAYVDFRDLIKRTDIDAVVIATPDHWHAIPCLEACKAKKDIYCEKPLTLTILEAKKLVEAVRKYRVIFQTGSQQRSSKEFRTACELVRNGRLGKLRKVIVDVGGPSRPCDLPEDKEEPGLDWDRWLGPSPKRPYSAVLSPRGVHGGFPNWRLYREYSGGMMTDWGAHHFDIAQWGLGMDRSGPVEIIPPEDPKKGVGVRYVYANGVEVIHGSSGGVKFIGPEGEIVVNRGKLTSKPDTLLKEPLGEKAVRLYNSPGHQRDWLECIKSRKLPICDVEVGARSVTVCHLGNLAYWNGRKLRWDAEKWEFVGDAEAMKWLDRERRAAYQLPEV